jgi:hypothetical protein
MAVNASFEIDILNGKNILFINRGRLTTSLMNIKEMMKG